MAAQAGFWSASAGADPLGTAEALLRWRDELRWAGWTGTPISPRLDALHRLTAAAPPGPADVAVEALGLAATPALAWHVRSVDGSNSGLVARMLDVLRAGHSALQMSLKPSAPEVLLIEPGSLVDGAEAAAHWLGQGGSRLVVGREPLLDDALMRAGLPTLGHSGPVADDLALAVLPAVVALAFDSDHPSLAQRLLRLPASPVHFHYRGRLLAALSDWPSTTSPTWQDAVARADDKLTEPEKDTAQQRLKNIFDPFFGVDRRITLVEHWATERIGTSAASPSWARVVEQCRQLRRLMATTASKLGALDLLRLVDVASEDVGAAARHPAEAGIAHVAEACCVLGEVDRLVWWVAPDAVRSTPRLTSTERTALASVGVALPDAPTVARRRAAAWARALTAPKLGILVVAPRIDAQGNTVQRPSVVDELQSFVDVSRSAALLSNPLGQRPTLRAAAQPRSTWTAPTGRVRLREVESPNSVATLLGCSLRWSLRYSTAVSSAADGGLVGGPLLFGRLAHELLHRVLVQLPAASAEMLAEHTGTVFDAVAPALASTLFLPGSDADRAAVRAVVIDAARIVGQLMEDLNLRVMSTEQPYSDQGTWLGAKYEGRPDLVLGPSPMLVLDFKWSLGRHRDAMRAGTAHQLASYSFLVGAGVGHVDVGYLVLRLRQVMTTSKLAARGVRQIEGPPPTFTFAALQHSAAVATAKLTEGMLLAPGADGRDDVVDRVDESGLSIAPPCSFCEYGVLCGRAIGGVR
jgi:hypothetical protein